MQLGIRPPPFRNLGKGNSSSSSGAPPTSGTAAGAPPRGPSGAQLDDRPRPFRNLGNTCYMSATLVALFGPTHLRDYFTATSSILSEEERAQLLLIARAADKSLDLTEPEETTADQLLAETYRLSFEKPRGTPQSPNLIYNRYPNVACEQQDAHEFLVRLVSDAPTLDANLATWVRPSLRCSECGAARMRPQEKHCVLSVDIRNNSGAIHTLQQALDIWLQPERMPLDYRWKCSSPACGSAAPPSKHNTISSSPNVLVLHLKRWPPGASEGLIDALVEPTPTLQFDDKIYHLRSVILHRGATASSGHYVAVMHQPLGEASQWWHYDDSCRRAVIPRHMTRVWKTYMCIYEQPASGDVHAPRRLPVSGL